MHEIDTIANLWIITLEQTSFQKVNLLLLTLIEL